MIQKMKLLHYLLFLAFVLSFAYVTYDEQQITDKKSDGRNVFPPLPEKEKEIMPPSRAQPINTTQNDSLEITLDDLLGRINMRKHSDFVNVDVKYAVHPHFWLRKKVYISFLKMRHDALKHGILLQISSAGRSFYDQKGIWEAKWRARRKKFPSDQATAENILKYSAMPGMSRHHWGTDIDLNQKHDRYWQTKKGIKEYQWLVENAHRYGFCQTYTPKNATRPEGYNEEKWHWSYMPLASQFLEKYKTLVQDKDIKGFLGSDQASTLRTIERYVFSINPDCQ